MENQQNNQRNDTHPVIGVTHGNINGVSYEVLMKVFSDSRVFDFFTPVVYGSSKVASYHRKVLDYGDFSFNLIKRADFANKNRANIINITDDEIRIELGKATVEAAKMSILALDTAISDFNNRTIDAIVNMPVGGSSFKLAETDFRDTEDYLKSAFGSIDPMMMLVSDELRIAFLSCHIPFINIQDTITPERIEVRITQLNESLRKDFAISTPKIAVLTLNPNCEIDVVLGAEENDGILSVIKKCSDKGIHVLGTYASDQFFESNNYKEFDAVLALYHEQGLLPFRLLSVNPGVIFYSGLPCIVVQPSHDSGLKKAGEGTYNPDATRNAMYLAQKIFFNRKQFAEEHNLRSVPAFKSSE